MGEVTMIRHMIQNQGKSIRETARETGRSRNTIRKYLNQSEPKYQKKGPRPRPVFDKVRPRIDEILEDWKNRTTRKQRITAARIHRELMKEGYKVGITLVQDYLREERRLKAEVYVPLKHYPGDEAQVDFFQVSVDINGKRKKLWLFVMRLMYSGLDYVRIYERCDQLSFLDAHVKAFDYLGAVPRRIVYDNLKPAVKRRVGVFRELTDRFHALASHYLFEPCFARPGEGHDKGGVESRGRGIRWRHLTPVPKGDALEDINTQLLENVEQEGLMKKDRRGKNVKQRFEEEIPEMKALPEHSFDARKPVFTRVSKSAMIQIEGAKYSVPSQWAMLQVVAHLGISDIVVVCRDEKEILPRVGRGEKRINYRHYLRELSRKPQAVRQVAPELISQLGSPFDTFWSMLLKEHSQMKSARTLSRVLGLMIDHGENRVRKAISQLIDKGQTDLLKLSELFKKEEKRTPIPAPLAGYRIESVKASSYNDLLKGGRI